MTEQEFFVKVLGLLYPAGSLIGADLREESIRGVHLLEHGGGAS